MHYVITAFENASFFVVTMIYIYLAVVVIFIIMENRDISSTLAWILVFLLFPIIGFFLYIFFGRNWKIVNPKKKDRIHNLHEKTEAVLEDIRNRQEILFEKISKGSLSHGIKRMLRIAQKNSDALLTLNNSVTVLHTGQGKFEQLKKDLKKAESFIHMEYFIWRIDPLTKEIKDILIEKAQSGVEVRILFDPIGSFLVRLMNHRYFKELKKVGVEVTPFFNTLSPLRITTINYLLHRKIVVIDGKIGYTGGMNMAQEYTDGGKRFSAWKDTHVRIAGMATLSLQMTFAVNWEEAKKESLFGDKYFPLDIEAQYGEVPVQVISSEPHAYWQPIKQSLFAMVLSAEKHVYIQTPYFIPDANLFEALKVIALSGVDVKVMVTGQVDKMIPYWAAFTYFQELLHAGVKIYHYNEGFMHAKTISVDGQMCSIGTTNMDIRSLHLSYENNVVIYDEKVTKELEHEFVDDLTHCKRFTWENYKKINVFAKFRNSLVRLLSPLL